MILDLAVVITVVVDVINAGDIVVSTENYERNGHLIIMDKCYVIRKSTRCIAVNNVYRCIHKEHWDTCPKLTLNFIENPLGLCSHRFIKIDKGRD